MVQEQVTGYRIQKHERTDKKLQNKYSNLTSEQRIGVAYEVKWLMRERGGVNGQGNSGEGIRLLQ